MEKQSMPRALCLAGEERTRLCEVVLATETEIKVSIAGPEAFLPRLRALHPRTVSDRHFEDNYLLDFPDRTLQKSRSLVRIRITPERAFLTYKGPPAEEGIFRSLEEIETGVGDGSHALEIFQRLGMNIWFRYQKYRREYSVDGVLVAIDETPIGDFAELEGAEAGILALANKLDLDVSEFIPHNYYALYVKACLTRGIKPGSMVFDPEQISGYEH